MFTEVGYARILKCQIVPNYVRETVVSPEADSLENHFMVRSWLFACFWVFHELESYCDLLFSFIIKAIFKITLF